MVESSYSLCKIVTIVEPGIGQVINQYFLQNLHRRIVLERAPRACFNDLLNTRQEPKSRYWQAFGQHFV
jgi:hypothetical protein